MMPDQLRAAAEGHGRGGEGHGFQAAAGRLGQDEGERHPEPRDPGGEQQRAERVAAPTGADEHGDLGDRLDQLEKILALVVEKTGIFGPVE